MALKVDLKSKVALRQSRNGWCCGRRRWGEGALSGGTVCSVEVGRCPEMDKATPSKQTMVLTEALWNQF